MPPTSSRRALTPFRTLVAAVVTTLVAGMLALVAPTAAVAAEGSIVDGGFIISDEEFYDYDSMSEGQIQAFLDARVDTCGAKADAPKCLKDFTADIDVEKVTYCEALVKTKDASAAHVIWAVANACHISPEVILVMLQKEQGLVTAKAPTAWNYDHAMGANCPDTTGCSADSAGFVNQVYRGANLLQYYKATAKNQRYRAGYATDIQWHPDRSCGTSTVLIQNQATAALYIYTPYRPNLAALAAGSARGDGCSSYGNRNFYNYYQSWFAGGPSTAALVGTCPQPPAAEIAAATGYVVVTTTVLNVRQAPTTRCVTGATTAAKGTVVARTGVYGSWTRAVVGGKTVWLSNYTRDEKTGVKTITLTEALITPVPTISGAAVAGQILTAKTGTWSPKPASFTYQWKRDGANVSGATGATYRVTNADAGKKLTVTVTAKFTGGQTSVSKTSAAVAATGYKATRIAGDDRYETAVKVSKATYPDGAKTVYIVDGNDFADALTAAPIAAIDNAALLLANKGGLHDVTKAELKRLKPTKVVLVGGPVALDKKTEGRITALLGDKVTVARIQGADRYDTARRVAARLQTRVDSISTVFLATGRNYADALGAAAVAGDLAVPVVLTDGADAKLDAATRDALKSLKTKNVVIVGREVAMSRGIEKSLASAGFTVERIGGETRYETNTLLNSRFFPTSASQAVVAWGEDYPDALTGAVLAAQTQSPLLVTGAACLAGGASDFLRSRKVGSYAVIGGEKVMSPAVLAARRC